LYNITLLKKGIILIAHNENEDDENDEDGDYSTRH